MKRKLLSCLMLVLGWSTWAQTLPETPNKVEFAHVQVHLDPDTRLKVNAEIQRLLTPQSTYLTQKLERMQLYFPIIERILQEENVPDDMKYLAVLESDLNPNAVSPTKAVGYWQFKDFTAQEMGLTISGSQDDRKNLHLSTRAAAQYLRKNNQVFKNWISTTLAYTVGAGGAAKLVPVDWSFASEIKLSNPHPYLIKALAHKVAFTHRLRQIQPTSRVLVEFPAKGKRLSEIASEINVSEDEIRQLNPWFTSSAVPTDKDYIVLVKTDQALAGQLTMKANDLATTDYISIGYPKLTRETMVVTSTDQPVFYKINQKKGILAQAGDDVASLARKGKVSIYKFLSYNDMTDRDPIKEGTVYYLQKKRSKGPVPYHTLSEGQKLWDVAHMYGFRLKNLKKFNRISDQEEIRPGRVMWMQKRRPAKTAIQYNPTLVAPPEVFSPERTEAAAPSQAPVQEEVPPSRYITHMVLENETLATLAKKYNTTVENLREINKLGPFESIKVNQRLVVPYTDAPEDDWVEDEKKPEQPVLMPPKRETAVTNTATDTKPVEKAEPEPIRPIEPVVEILPAETPKRETAPATPIGKTQRHTVKRGETLYGIARAYGITIEELRQLNRMAPGETLKSGTTLLVPSSGNDHSPAPAVGTHTVRRGETLFSIANQYGMSVSELKELNRLSSNAIQAGQKLNVTAGSNTPVQYHTVRAGETLFSIANRYGVSVNELKRWNQMTSNTLLVGKKLIVKP